MDHSQAAAYIGANARVYAVIVQAGLGIKGVLYAGLRAAVTCNPRKNKTQNTKHRRSKSPTHFTTELACSSKIFVRSYSLLQ